MDDVREQCEIAATAALKSDDAAPEPTGAPISVVVGAGAGTRRNILGACQRSGVPLTEAEVAAAAVAIHVEFGSVDGCEAARSVLSTRTFDGRRLLAVFALPPTLIANDDGANR